MRTHIRPDDGGRSVEQWRRLNAADTYVYRAFDGHGLLLYVGCTVNVDSRLSTHRTQSPWFRFAETIGTEVHPSRGEALAAEAAAIETEGSYFNASKADIGATQANRNAARRLLGAGGHFPPHCTWAILDSPALYAVHELASEAYRLAHERMRARLKASSHPYLTDADRLARYRAAREDAALALTETWGSAA